MNVIDTVSVSPVGRFKPSRDTGVETAPIGRKKVGLTTSALQLSFMPFYPRAATQPGPSTASAHSSKYNFNWRRLQGVRDDKFMAPTIGTLKVLSNPRKLISGSSPDIFRWSGKENKRF